jgi:hypothetical protein
VPATVVTNLRLVMSPIGLPFPDAVRICSSDRQF